MRHFSLVGVVTSLTLSLLLFAGCEKFDPSGLEKEINDLKERVSKLESVIDVVNKDIKSLAAVIGSLQDRLYVDSVEFLDGGYVITFSDGSKAEIHDGATGETGPQGPSGKTPVIGAALVDGVYYWTVDGNFLLDQKGQKIPVTGNGGDVPVIGVKEISGVYYWTVNGSFLLDGNGNKIPASSQAGGSSIFKSVVMSGNEVVFTLLDGTGFSIPLKSDASLKLESNQVYFGLAETKSIKIAKSGIDELAICEKPEGWRARIEGSSLVVTAPSSLENAEKDGYVAILATAGGSTLIAKVFVSASDADIVLSELLQFSNIKTDDASLDVSLGKDFYGGVHLYDSTKPYSYYAEMFLADAEGPFSGFGGGQFGCMNDGPSYSGRLTRFANLDDGDGGKNAWSFCPGMKYIVACVPMEAGKNFEDYTASDVLLQVVSFEQPKKMGSANVSISKTDSDMSSVTVTFKVSGTKKYYYKIVTKKVFDESGLSVYDFALLKGNMYDLSIPNSGDGTISLSVDYQEPSTPCIAVAVAFDKNGNYAEEVLEVSTDAIVKSEQDVTIKGHTVTAFSANSNLVVFELEAGEAISKVRYKHVTPVEAQGYTMEAAFQDLMLGGMWARDGEVSPSSNIELYAKDSQPHYIYYVGIEESGSITEIKRYEFVPE